MLWTKKMNSGSKDEHHIVSHKGKSLTFIRVLLCNKIKPAYYEASPMFRGSSVRNQHIQ